jgi:hypothetical protein
LAVTAIDRVVSGEAPNLMGTARFFGSQSDWDTTPTKLLENAKKYFNEGTLQFHLQIGTGSYALHFFDDTRLRKR